MILLSGLQGSIEENLSPIVSVVDTESIQISPVGMTQLNLSKGNRVEFGMDIDPETKEHIFFITVLDPESKKGRSLSSTGRFHHPTIASALRGHQWEISKEKTEMAEIMWHKLSIFEALAEEVVEEVSSEVVEEVEETVDEQQTPVTTDVRNDIPEINEDEEY